MFFKPVTLILDRLRFPGKFGLIFLIILIPAVIFAFTTFFDIQAKTHIIDTQHMGVDYLEKTQPLLKFIPQHRGLSQGFLKGKTELKGRLEELQQKVNTSMQELEKMDRKFSEFFLTFSLLGDIYI